LNAQSQLAKEKQEQEQKKREQQIQLQQNLALKEQALEHAIDSERYIVGPGDVFIVNLWGIVNENFTIKVSPEGNLLIPTVTEFSVENMTLAEVQQKIIEETKKVYIDSKITVNLLSLRKFRVAVTGAVQFPGTYVVTAADRVSEAIEAAGGFWEDELSATDRTKGQTKEQTREDERIRLASLRNIELKRKDGSKQNVDLLMYREVGDKETNPFLLDGDVVYVPFIKEEIGFIQIYGAVNKEGEYEFSEGDRLLDIIDLAHGIRYDAQIERAEIIRFADKNTTVTIEVDLVSALDNPESEENIVLFPDDRIFIRSVSQFHEKEWVIVSGEVVYPGIYVIEEGKTKLSEVLAQAGGLTDKASLLESRLIRQAREDIVDPEYERLKRMSVEDMTEIEYEYFKMKSRQTSGIVAVDFIDLFREGDYSQDVALRSKDIIQIQTLTQTVNIIGAVGFPGITSFESGKTLGAYVRQAGGYSWNADKSEVRLIKARTGEWVKADEDDVVELGDTIFIPEKPKRDWWGIFKDVLQVTTQVTALLVLVQNVTQN
jgi:protein involved in polysaccharide export with SLBB domain